MILWTETILDGMWRGAIVVLPLALLTSVICRQLKYRPGARHALWLTVLMGLVVSPFLPTAIKSPSPSDASDGAMVPASELEARDPELLASTEPSDTTRFAAPAPLAHHQPVAPESTLMSGSTPMAGDPSRDEVPTVVTLQTAEPREGLIEAQAGSVHGDCHAPALVGAAMNQSNHLATPHHADETSPSDVCNRQEALVNRTDVAPVAFDDSSALVMDDPPADHASSSSESFTSSVRARFAGFIGAWRHWGGQIATARDALGKVSPIPASLWIFGAVCYALTLWINGLRMSRLLRHATDAPPHLRRLVARVANDLGLRRIPQCIIVPHRVSPMIWCGLRQRLVLPADLWEELDADGRVAVITHELAHLRRRDHWVRWLDAAVGCVYWWHPVVWFVRSRISMEAENCCDAWVTWLNPRSRRAYAEALLAARQYISSNIQAVPAVGMGAGTRKSKTFARRLTMIMTRKDAPGMSAMDWAFALVVVMTGWLATPARSDAPVASDPQDTYAVVESDDGVITVGSVAKTAPTASGVVHVVASHAPGEDELEDRLERLERQMSRLIEKMESRGIGSSSRTSVVPRLSRVPAPPTLPTAPAIVLQQSGRVYAQTYKLSGGKLEALTALMSRDDVPVVISPAKGAIVVNGTSDQHAVFARFLDAIGDEGRQSSKLSGGKLEALSKLMIRSDVPIHVAPGDDHIEVIGSPAEREAVANFIKLINGEPVSNSHTRLDQTRWSTKYPGGLGRNNQQVGNTGYSNALKAYGLAQQRTEESQRQALLTERTAVREHLLELRHQAQSLQRERESIERIAEQLREKAEQIREQSERSRERTEELRNRSSKDRAASPDVLEELADAARTATAFEIEAEAMTAEADGHSANADALALQIDMLENQAEALEDYLSNLGEISSS